MGNEQSNKSGGNQNPANQMQSSENMNAQLTMAVESKAVNNMVTKQQFNEVLTLFSLSIQAARYVPIFDGLYDLIEPVRESRAKPKYNVSAFLIKMATDESFLEESKSNQFRSDYMINEVQGT